MHLYPVQAEHPYAIFPRQPGYGNGPNHGVAKSMPAPFRRERARKPFDACVVAISSNQSDN
jgi:hypothetical protein